VEAPNIGNGQARIKLEDGDIRMMMNPAYLEPAHVPMSDASAPAGPVGHTPQWLQSSAKDVSTALDALGNQLQPGDKVKLRSKSQYDDKTFTVEATDVGDGTGRVRVCLQVGEKATSRMAFESTWLERVETAQPLPTAGAQEVRAVNYVQAASGTAPSEMIQASPAAATREIKIVRPAQGLSSTAETSIISNQAATEVPGVRYVTAKAATEVRDIQYVGATAAPMTVTKTTVASEARDIQYIKPTATTVTTGVAPEVREIRYVSATAPTTFANTAVASEVQPEVRDIQYIRATPAASTVTTTAVAPEVREVREVQYVSATAPTTFANSAVASEFQETQFLSTTAATGVSAPTIAVSQLSPVQARAVPTVDAYEVQPISSTIQPVSAMPTAGAPTTLGPVA